MASERARLVEAHIDLARRIASAIHPRVRQYMELEELIAAKLGNPTVDPHGDPIPSREL